MKVKFGQKSIKSAFTGAAAGTAMFLMTSFASSFGEYNERMESKNNKGIFVVTTLATLGTAAAKRLSMIGNPDDEPCFTLDND